MVTERTRFTGSPLDRLADRHGHWRELRRHLEEVSREGGQGSARGAYIAISRQAGAGGEAVARAVGAALGWHVLDRELLDFLAEQVQESPEALKLLDETAASWFDQSIFNLMRPHLLSQDEYVARLARIVLLSVSQRPSVVVGRGAHHFLPRSWGLAVRLVAPLALRIGRVEREQGLDRRAAARWVAATDRDREAFVRRHFGQDPCDVVAFDLVINTESLGVEGAAAVIVAAARIRGLALQ
ncbi:MAG TPA: cytidylate kinase-like family protein [Thermoanaerobaculaceae bacterium]|nr:cytidylate kinase-like family protein [Thermoanaerobaculaceae bacterium]HRS15554.1 cytidylate kinase-like family protein [Thermoanaerobaculaceae bacterium]